jgi:phosphatidyl-myo-inositol dimannoside synthase
MNILIVSSEFPPGPGGIGTHAQQLASGFASLSWKPLVLTSQDYASDEEIDRFNQVQPFPVVRFRRIGNPLPEALYREALLGRWIRRHNAQVLIASGSRSVILLAGRVHERKLPWIAVAHGSEVAGPAGWEARAVRWAFGRATSVVCVSDFTRQQLGSAGVAAPRTLVIPNGADHTRFVLLPAEDARAVRRELGLEGTRLLITVGNVTERKGQDTVVRALPAILREAPSTHYLVAGLPTKGEELQNLARELGVADRVHLLGRTEAGLLVRLLNAADVCVMTSRRTSSGEVEGYGIAAVEAALCGLPSVVAGGSGLAEAVQDRVTGLVVPPDDHGATAAAVLLLLGDEAARKEMGERARRRAQTEQTWHRSVQRYAEVVRGLAHPVSSPATRGLPSQGRLL